MDNAAMLYTHCSLSLKFLTCSLRHIQMSQLAILLLRNKNLIVSHKHKEWWSTYICFPIFSLDHVPFKEFLVYPKPNYFEPAEYLNDIKSPPDWEIIFHKESLSCQEKQSSYSPVKDLEGMLMNSNFKPKLDPTQLAAVELALKNKLVLIQVML